MSEVHKSKIDNLTDFFLQRPLLLLLLSFLILGGGLAAEMRLIAAGDDLKNKEVEENINALRDYVKEEILEGYGVQVADNPRYLEARAALSQRGLRCFLDSDGNPTRCDTTDIFTLNGHSSIHSFSRTEDGGVTACAPSNRHGNGSCGQSSDGTYPYFDWVKGGLLTEVEVSTYAQGVVQSLIADIRTQVATGEAEAVDSLED